ncbi:hypothetical protein PTNB73_02435 [Pyrenophora teres f. teres]|uniref:Adenosine deaminase domain-containing protein n=2 Tax=Pyrenophora teres f. teres TaxID=97479 RepID=E3RGQ6_PYRTT|nr:hypothetical protein PTT_07000 [Pyrenophora teres f. teres 0-1]KAE8846450.1 hypothetical protein HRS9139_01017 [Pyrenophora teres f. teres]CAA9959621.1 hypothetical protein PTMSG1_03038 [Pyrenophora teres f. maculata]KAE8848590.1 hypothetical protein PTNB85_02433 [Pyrenophora teres f. teres]KAE8853242.1 hypothetical protein HRS9122_00234 [Pyrenophora teres f. teres]
MAPENKNNIQLIFQSALEDGKSIAKYAEERERLVKSEQQNAWDREARHKPSPQEERAANIIFAIREWERNVIFGNLPSETLPKKDDRDMGGQYLTNKEYIDTRSKLFEISKMVPKGALLHLHFNAELHPELLLVQARKTENMYIRSIRRIENEEDLKETEMVFMVRDHKTIDSSINVFSDAYPTYSNPKDEAVQDKIWMLWSKFQDEFERKFPGKFKQQEPETFREGNLPSHCGQPAVVRLRPAENWLRSKMVLSEKEAYDPSQTVNGVWARFNQATRAFKGLLNYERAYKEYIGMAIDRLIEEKIMYAELRPMLLDKDIPTNDGKGRIDNSGQMQLIIDAINEKKQHLKDAGRLHEFPFGLKIIYCTPRSIPASLMMRDMKECIELKMKYPDLICGFDLVGAEDRAFHIGHYQKQFMAFKKTCNTLGVEIPFMFHAGETLLDTGGSHDPANSNLYDAVALGAKRIGHGFALLKHPKLVDEFKKDGKKPGICIELCPISNELLHLCRNIKEHPYPQLLAAGIPCTVNSDNPSLFSNSMSHEFYQIMVGAPTMSLYSWKQLARWSIDYSCLSDKEQKEGHNYLDESWESFCNDVVNTYGPSVMHTDEEIARDPVLKDRVDPVKAAAYYGDDGEARWKSYEKKRSNKKYLEL